MRMLIAIYKINMYIPMQVQRIHKKYLIAKDKIIKLLKNLVL